MSKPKSLVKREWSMITMPKRELMIIKEYCARNNTKVSPWLVQVALEKISDMKQGKVIES
jgi:hypothetical protein